MAAPTKRAKYGGRRRGTPNKITGDIRAAVLRVAESGDGLDAWLEHVKMELPEQYIKLLIACMPKEIKLNVQNTVQLVSDMEKRAEILEIKAKKLAS